MNTTISTTPFTPSTPSTSSFDAGRQPLIATLQFNTPEQKRSVKVRKHADVFFSPRAVNPWANPAQSPEKVKDVAKSQKSIEVPKWIADMFFSPQAVSTPINTTCTLNKIDVEDFADDDDIPLAILIKKALSSFATGPSTLKRIPRVKKRPGPVDSEDPEDEDLPLSRVKELMIKLGRRPFVHESPPPFKQTIKPTLLRPATIPMKCIAPNCPFSWHVHVTAASH